MDIRNIAIIAHVDHGKTTLVDAMLRQSGLFRENEHIAERAMDSLDQEKERGITIEAKNASFTYKGTKVNIVDTPGHADFGGEVERILHMVDGACLLVDASEGPLPQTRFVLKKALTQGLKILVIINKIDRPDARIQEVENEIFDLFIDLECDEAQMDYPMIYTIARRGIALNKRPEEGDNMNTLEGSLEPLFEAIRTHVPPPTVKPNDPLAIRVTNLQHNDFLGRISIGRIEQGSIKAGQQVLVVGKGGTTKQWRVQELMGYHGMKQAKAPEMLAGDIAAIAGIENVNIGDTITVPENPVTLPRVEVDPPAVTMSFFVNSSPFAGREGKVLLSRELGERLRKEGLRNVAIKVEPGDTPDEFRVSGRGELQLAVIVENIRREGFELALGKPKAALRTINGEVEEPIEMAYIDLPEIHFGVVSEMFHQRKGKMVNMVNKGSGRVRMEFEIPARGLIGIRSNFLTSTRGTGILNTLFHGYQPFRGEIPSRIAGALLADREGETVTYGLAGLEDRGRFFVGPNVPVYEGMIVGEQNRDGDLYINVCRAKKLTNMRAAGSDDLIQLAPPVDMSLEKALEWIKDDELVEVTPETVRIRKKKLKKSGQ